MYTQTHINPFWIHHVHLGANKLVFTNSDMYVHTHTDMHSYIHTHTEFLSGSMWQHQKESEETYFFEYTYVYTHTQTQICTLMFTRSHTHTEILSGSTSSMLQSKVERALLFP